MPGQLLDPASQQVENDENYVSSEDEDFNPEAAAAQPQASSDSEAEDGFTAHSPAVAESKARPNKTEEDEAEDLGFENSGDEGIIKAGAKEARRRKRKRKEGIAQDGEDSGGEGGFVRTRSMKAAAYESLVPPSLDRALN